MSGKFLVVTFRFLSSEMQEFARVYVVFYLSSFFMIYEEGVNWFFFPCVLKLPSLPPTPLQPDLEQNHELGLLCTNEME